VTDKAESRKRNGSKTAILSNCPQRCCSEKEKAGIGGRDTERMSYGWDRFWGGQNRSLNHLQMKALEDYKHQA
jgi:hypothetical protein